MHILHVHQGMVGVLINFVVVLGHMVIAAAVAHLGIL
jgi:hypothetical protein